MQHLPDKTSYRIVQLSDCHLLADKAGLYQGVNPYGYLLDSIRAIAQDMPDAVIISGDVTQDHSAASYQLLQQVVSLLSCPVLILPGNHDDLTLLQQLRQQAPFVDEHILQLAGWQLYLMNTKGETPAGVFDLTRQQTLQQWLAKSDEHVWLFCHHHPLPLNSFIDLHGQQHQDALWQLLSQYPRVKGIAHGHCHYAYYRQHQGIDIVGCPATSVQFLQMPDWQTQDLGPRWCEWHFAANGQVSWIFKGLT